MSSSCFRRAFMPLLSTTQFTVGDAGPSSRVALRRSSMCDVAATSIRLSHNYVRPRRTIYTTQRDVTPLQGRGSAPTRQPRAETRPLVGSKRRPELGLPVRVSLTEKPVGDHVVGFAQTNGQAVPAPASDGLDAGQIADLNRDRALLGGPARPWSAAQTTDAGRNGSWFQQ
jgi:hypothetical protein